jgi:hypothetical protein
LRQPPRGCLLGASGSLKWCAAAPSLRTRCPLPLGPSADQRRSAGRSCLHEDCGGGWWLRLGPADDRGRGSRRWRCWRPRIRPAWGRSASLAACCCACASVRSARADAPGGDTVAVWPRRAAAERAHCGCGFALLRSGRVACPWVPCGRSQPRAHAQPHVATDHAIFTVSRPCLTSLYNLLSLVSRRS